MPLLHPNDIKRKLNIDSEDTSYDTLISDTIDGYETAVLRDYEFGPSEIENLSKEQHQRLLLGITTYIAGKVLTILPASMTVAAGGQSVSIGPIRYAGLGGSSATYLSKAAKEYLEEGRDILTSLRVEAFGKLGWRAV